MAVEKEQLSCEWGHFSGEKCRGEVKKRKLEIKDKNYKLNLCEGCYNSLKTACGKELDEIEVILNKTIEKQKEEINFDCEYFPPKKEITNLEQLKGIITQHFPTLWEDTKARLSIACSLSLKNLNGCPSLNLVGNPSGEKTTILSFFYGHNISYISDDFTPRAFVSHAANVKEENLEKIDLKNTFIYSDIVFKITEDGLISFDDRNGEEILIEPEFVTLVTRIEGEKNG